MMNFPTKGGRTRNEADRPSKPSLRRRQDVIVPAVPEHADPHVYPALPAHGSAAVLVDSSGTDALPGKIWRPHAFAADELGVWQTLPLGKGWLGYQMLLAGLQRLLGVQHTATAPTNSPSTATTAASPAAASAQSAATAHAAVALATLTTLTPDRAAPDPAAAHPAASLPAARTATLACADVHLPGLIGCAHVLRR